MRYVYITSKTGKKKFTLLISLFTLQQIKDVCYSELDQLNYF